MRLMFAVRGRIGRGLWWSGVGTLIVYHLIAVLLLIDIYGSVPPPSHEGRLVLLALCVLGLVMSFCLAAKRFHDRGRSAWFAGAPAAVMLVKSVLDAFQVTGVAGSFTWVDYAFAGVQLAIGIWFIVELGMLRGTPGDNAYGPDPLRPAGVPAPTAAGS